MNARTKRKSLMHRDQDMVESMATDSMQDDDSVATTMGVRPTTMPMAAMNRAPSQPAVCAPFVIPKGLPGAATGDDDDDISVLTEFSLMDDEEDALSQVTTWTVVTTGTDSTTIPRRNTVPVQSMPAAKRRHAMIKVPYDNSSFKRRRRR